MALTDWMAARWIESGYVEPLDKANIPNVEAQLISALQDPTWDSGRNFSAPWQAGMDGLGYNTAETGGEISSFNDIFDPQFKGRVSMLSEWRDSLGLVLQGMGVNTEDATLDDAMAGIEKVKAASDSGQIRRFTGNDYTNDLTSGNLAIAVAYSGDVIQLQADNSDLEFLIPEEGGLIWADNMMIPQGRRASLRGRGLHQLRLRARGGGPDRDLRELRDAVRGCQGDPREDRPGPGQ